MSVVLLFMCIDGPLVVIPVYLSITFVCDYFYTLLYILLRDNAANANSATLTIYTFSLVST